MAPQGRLAFAAALAVLLCSHPALAQAPPSASGTEPAPIPTPLVSPMVVPLGIGARPPSVSLTAQVPLTGTQPVSWSPEVQWAPLDGVGLGLLACIEDADVEDIQAVAQVTLGRLGEGFIHGALVGAGIVPDDGDAAVGVWYLPGYRFDDMLSVQALIGAAATVGDQRSPVTLAGANVSAFAELSPSLTLAFEAAYEIPTRGASSREWTLLLMPEVLWSRGRWSLGVGFGALVTQHETDPTAVASLGYAF